MSADSPHKRWTRSPYVEFDGKLQKPLICSKCGRDLFTILRTKAAPEDWNHSARRHLRQVCKFRVRQGHTHQRAGYPR